MKPFLSDITAIRKRAREHILSGALTSSYEGDLKQTLKILNEVLATELVCTLRYRNHYFMAEGFQAKAISEEFLEHSNEEQEHADWVAKRIKQLGGTPNFNPEGLLTRSHAEYQEGETLVEMIQEDLIAERIAIETYNEIIRYFATHDPTSRRLMEEILAKEEEHADELADYLKALDPSKKPTEDGPWLSEQSHQ
jgi:bacterioferritin